MTHNPVWSEWYHSRFEPVLEKARLEALDASVEYRASLELLELICRYAGHAADGVGLWFPDHGLLKREVPAYIFGRDLAEALSSAGVRPGNNTAIYMEELLRPFQHAEGLPGGILFVAERYENTPPWADKNSLRHYDFRYYVVIHFPD